MSKFEVIFGHAIMRLFKAINFGTKLSVCREKNRTDSKNLPFHLILLRVRSFRRPTAFNWYNERWLNEKPVQTFNYGIFV